MEWMMNLILKLIKKYMTNELKINWLADLLSNIDVEKSHLNLELMNCKAELEKTALQIRIKEIETDLKNLNKREEELKEIGKNIMINSWLKKFEWLNWQVIQLNKKPWALQIEDESKIPQEYFKTVTTTTINKTQLKEDIKQGCIIDWCYISEDYSLIIKNK